MLTVEPLRGSLLVDYLNPRAKIPQGFSPGLIKLSHFVAWGKCRDNQIKPFHGFGGNAGDNQIKPFHGFEEIQGLIKLSHSMALGEMLGLIKLSHSMALGKCLGYSN